VFVFIKVSRTILKSGFVVIAFLVTGRFVISALGMILLVFMSDFVKIALSTDRVRPSQMPESWDIGPLVRLAILLGLLMLIEALGLFTIGWHWFDLGVGDGHLQTFAFQTLLFFALFSILSIRERRAFWAARPSPGAFAGAPRRRGRWNPYRPLRSVGASAAAIHPGRIPHRLCIGLLARCERFRQARLGPTSTTRSDGRREEGLVVAVNGSIRFRTPAARRCRYRCNFIAL
jgi:hypothetical protein